MSETTGKGTPSASPSDWFEHSSFIDNICIFILYDIIVNSESFKAKGNVPFEFLMASREIDIRGEDLLLLASSYGGIMWWIFISVKSQREGPC